MRWHVAIVVVVVVVAACSKRQADDCVIVREKPTSAMAELSSRYPNNPVKVAETIEKCVAPSGDECARLAKIVVAIPSMMPQLALPKSVGSGAGAAADVTRMCETAPPEFRRCLLPSYALAHADECREVVSKSISQIEITPSAGQRAAGGDDDCGFVAIYVDEEGTWLATGRDAKSRCYAARKGRELDGEWLEAQLRRAKAHPCGPSSAEIAAADDVSYQDMITTMDIAVKAGFMNTGLSSPAELSVPLATASSKGAASECPATLIAAEPKDAPPPRPTAPPAPSGPPPSGTDKLQSAPVLIITPDTLTLKSGDASTEIATVADAQTATKLDALTKALPPTRDGLLILQADQRTPTKVINLVVTTVKAAGYDNVMFAVKNR